MNPIKVLFAVWKYILVNIVLIAVYFAFVDDVPLIMIWIVAVGMIVNIGLMFGDFIRITKGDKI